MRRIVPFFEARLASIDSKVFSYAFMVLLPILIIVSVGGLESAGASAGVLVPATALLGVVIPLLLALRLERASTSTLVNSTGRLSAAFLLGAVAWGLIALVFLQAGLPCDCPAEIYTPGRGWHYNECFCGIEIALVPMGIFAAVVLTAAMNVAAWATAITRTILLSDPASKVLSLVGAFLRRWYTTFVYSIPLGWVLLNLVTVRWGQADVLAPMWGFPFPWAWWPPVSSLHWELSIPALVLNVLSYSIVITLVGTWVGRKLPEYVTRFRGGFAGASILVAIVFALPWLFGIFVGFHSFDVWLSTEYVTGISVGAPGDCYLTY